MSKNATLSKANKAKNDEFYTQRSDVERELHHYKDQFRGKTVLCNCDDPFESAFFQFFVQNFNAWGLKKLMATSYVGSPVAGEQLSLAREPYRVEITKVPRNMDGGDLPSIMDLLRSKPGTWTVMSGDGDFRSDECVTLLEEADIVVTNPPFSLFREYIAQLMQYGKKFLVIGNMNAITYKETFKLIMEDKLWLGYENGQKWYRVPDGYTHTASESSIKVEDGIRYLSMGNTSWFTNLDTKKRHEFITPYKRYTPAEYPHYDNYDAIEVSKVSDIPMNYDGAMGVPITFLDKYNPEQFEIIGSSYLLAESIPNCKSKREHRFYLPEVNGRYYGGYRRLYDRIVIRKTGASS
jgi:hypothetical protein